MVANPYHSRLLCHALQFAFKSIAYYIRRATLINVSAMNLGQHKNLMAEMIHS